MIKQETEELDEMYSNLKRMWYATEELEEQLSEMNSYITQLEQEFESKGGVYK